MTINKALFSSASREWETPQSFYDLLDAEFGFTLDPCATSENAKCEHYFTKAENGLTQNWHGTVYVNPPYGRVIGDWVQKSYEEARAGALVVMLIPARTDTTYWHDYIMRASEIRFVRGRLKFGGASNSAPFPSAVVIFRPGGDGPLFVRSMNRAKRVKEAGVELHQGDCRGVGILA